MARIGFTGTQQGMTAEQNAAVWRLLKGNLPLDEFHEGDCVGADGAAAVIARKLGYWIISHPPLIQTKRAFFPADEERPPRDYLVRNHNIVQETQEMIATPFQAEEIIRSGTWATIRFAKKLRRKVTIILPSGELQVLKGERS